MGPADGAFEDLTEALAGAVALGATVMLVLAASALTVSAAIHRFRGRQASTRTRETLFVGRWGVLGPELYRIGRDVRRMHGPEALDPPALAFAREMLAEVMRSRPATQLARAFAHSQLEPLPTDGFVLSTSDVAAWLDARRGGPLT